MQGPLKAPTVDGIIKIPQGPDGPYGPIRAHIGPARALEEREKLRKNAFVFYVFWGILQFHMGPYGPGPGP